MRRLAGGFVATALLLGVVGFRVLDPVPAPAARRGPDVRRARPAPAEPERVSLFGDSLSYQARAAFLVGTLPLGVRFATVSTRPGAALCDDRDAIVRDLAAKRPDLLVLEYSGNSFTPCMKDGNGVELAIGSEAWRDRYRDDLARVVSMASSTGTEVVWATAPPVERFGSPPDYPARIAAVARELGGRDPNLRVADTGAAVSDPRGFARTLPCRPDEIPLCHDGRIVVRADDGLHFDCIGTIDVMGGCVGYSAGARRYGEALVATVEPFSASAPPGHRTGAETTPERAEDQLQPEPAPLTMPNGPDGQR